MSSKPKLPNLRLMLDEQEKRKAESAAGNEPGSKKTRKIRIWVDGCFDMVHYGHSNALRQAKALGDVLVVGVHSDEEIKKHKGPPVLTEEERYKLVRAVKWVDEVVEDVPYVTQLETLDKYKCDYCAHGGVHNESALKRDALSLWTPDDITIAPDGSFSYQAVYDAGKFQVFRRTQGVSTTDLVGRMLLLTKDHFIRIDEQDGKLEPKSPMKTFAAEATISSPFTGMYQFHPHTNQILQYFSEGTKKGPKDGEKVVFVAGAFDLFHAGHVDFLKACLQFGSYIIIGVHDDEVVNSYKGKNFPIMNIQERVLGCLACSYVSDVVIGAPYVVTDELLDFFKVDYVVHGSTPVKPAPDGTNVDPYEAPKKKGIFRTVDSGNSLTATEIVIRIIDNRLAYEDRNQRKKEKESKAVPLEN